MVKCGKNEGVERKWYFLIRYYDPEYRREMYLSPPYDDLKKCLDRSDAECARIFPGDGRSDKLITFNVFPVDYVPCDSSKHGYIVYCRDGHIRKSEFCSFSSMWEYLHGWMKDTDLSINKVKIW